MTKQYPGQQVLDKTIGELLAGGKKKSYKAPSGEVGIEIEVEGRNLMPNATDYWQPHADGSLRGEALEYVLREPIDRKEVRPALDSLVKALADYDSRVNMSYRTSVHVHLNVSKTSVRELYNHMILFLLFEDILVNFCGPERESNVFCLRGRDAEFLYQQLSMAAKTGQIMQYLGNDNLRYAAMNVAATAKYGSLEFRSLRGTTDPEIIEQWVKILLDLKDSASKFENPHSILGSFSQIGADNFVKQVMSPQNQRVITTYPDWQRVLYEGVHRVQDVAYCLPSWETVKPSKEEPVYGKTTFRNDGNVDINLILDNALRAQDGAPPRRRNAPPPPGWGEPVRDREDDDDLPDDL